MTDTIQFDCDAGRKRASNEWGRITNGIAIFRTFGSDGKKFVRWDPFIHEVLNEEGDPTGKPRKGVPKISDSICVR